ncbi:MAG: BarJ [uncultured bacterium]|nr:MAG: BarJ [uncultured bacterium]
MSKDYDIVILGGGWTGLLIAYLAIKKNKSVLILEKENELGGLARTISFENHHFDLGGHRIYFSDDENIKLIKELTPYWEHHTRKSAIYYNGEYLDYPPSFMNLFRLHKIPWYSIITDFIKGLDCDIHKNLENWILHFYGRTLYNIYFKDYTEKVWGLSCNQLASKWAEVRIGRISLFQILKELILKKSNIKENCRKFWYPSFGMEALIKTLETKIIEGGGTIYKNIKDIKILKNNNTLDSIAFDLNKITKNVSSNHFVSTIPLSEFINILDDIPDYIKIETNKLKFRNIILVGLVINRKFVTDFHWLYFPQKSLKISRIFEPKNWSSKLSNENETLLCVEMMCQEGDELWNSDDLLLSRIVTNDLCELKMIVQSEVLNHIVLRIPYAYPICTNQSESAKVKILDYCSNYNNLSLAGRQGTFSYLDMEECLDMAKNTIK